MEDLFDPACAEAMRRRIQSVTAASPRQWGRMSAAQMLEHCARGIEMGTGELMVPRVFIGRLLGGVIKRQMLKDGAQMRRNSPTAPCLLVADEREIDVARTRLLGAFDRFVAGGETGCTSCPHPFFGALTPSEWARLTHKHLDHHLRQFGA